MRVAWCVRLVNFASTAKICLFVHWKEWNEFMFVSLDSWSYRKLLLKQGVCLIQPRLQLASPEIKKKKMLIMQRRNHWNELFFAAFTWNSRERFWHGNFPLFSRPFIGGYQNFTVPPSPSHVCCQNWRKIQTCPLCCSASLMSFSYLWAAAVSSPPPMQRPPMKTRGTDDAPVSWGKKGYETQIKTFVSGWK